MASILDGLSPSTDRTKKKPPVRTAPSLVTGANTGILAGLTPSQPVEQAAPTRSSAPSVRQGGDVARGLQRGAANLKSSYGSVKEVYGELTDNEDIAASGAQIRESGQAKAAANPASGQFTDIGDNEGYLADAADWAQGTIAEQGPQFAGQLASGYLGGKAGMALGALTGPAAPVAAPVLGAVGAAIGYAAPSIFMNVGEAQSNIKERGGTNPRAAVALGVGAGAIDALPQARIGGAGKLVKQKLYRKALENMGFEGATEALQENLIDYGAAKATDTEYDFDLKNTVNAAAAGALVGGVATGAMQGIEALKPQAADEKPPEPPPPLLPPPPPITVDSQGRAQTPRDGRNLYDEVNPAGVGRSAVAPTPLTPSAALPSPKEGEASPRNQIIDTGKGPITVDQQGNVWDQREWAEANGRAPAAPDLPATPPTPPAALSAPKAGEASPRNQVTDTGKGPITVDQQGNAWDQREWTEAKNPEPFEGLTAKKKAFASATAAQNELKSPRYNNETREYFVQIQPDGKTAKIRKKVDYPQKAAELNEDSVTSPINVPKTEVTAQNSAVDSPTQSLTPTESTTPTAEAGGGMAPVEDAPQTVTEKPKVTPKAKVDPTIDSTPATLDQEPTEYRTKEGTLISRATTIDESQLPGENQPFKGAPAKSEAYASVEKATQALKSNRYPLEPEQYYVEALPDDKGAVIRLEKDRGRLTGQEKVTEQKNVPIKDDPALRDVPTSITGTSLYETPKKTDAAPETAVPEAAVPENVVTENAVPEKAVPEKAVPRWFKDEAEIDDKPQPLNQMQPTDRGKISRGSGGGMVPYPTRAGALARLNRDRKKDAKATENLEVVDVEGGSVIREKSLQEGPQAATDETIQSNAITGTSVGNTDAGTNIGDVVGGDRTIPNAATPGATPQFVPLTGDRSQDASVKGGNRAGSSTTQNIQTPTGVAVTDDYVGAVTALQDVVKDGKQSSHVTKLYNRVVNGETLAAKEVSTLTNVIARKQGIKSTQNSPETDEAVILRDTLMSSLSDAKFRRRGQPTSLPKLDTPEARAAQVEKDRPSVQGLNDTLARDLQDDGFKDAFEATEVPEHLAKIRQGIFAAFGKEAVPIKAKAGSVAEGQFDGVHIPREGGQIFVDVDSPTSFTAVAAHELSHDLEQNRPDLHKWLTNAAKRIVKPENAARHRRDLSKATKSEVSEKGAFDELLADFSGDSMNNTEFLKQLAKDNPSRFKELLEAVTEFLDKVVKRLTKAANEGLGSDNYISVAEATELRTYYREVLNAQANNRRADLNNVIDAKPRYRKRDQTEGALEPAPPQGPTGDNRISTRNPTSQKAPNDPLRENLQITVKSLKEAGGGLFEKMATKVVAYDTYKPSDRADTPEKQVRRYVTHLKNNLKWLHNQVPVEVRNRTKEWYNGANSVANRFAERYDVSERAASAVIASLSPQKDWYQNVSLAERVLDIWTEGQDFQFSNQMQLVATDIYAKAEYQAFLSEIHNKKLSELTEDDHRAMWVRIYDETYNSRSYREITAEGDFTDVAINKNKKGVETQSKTAWQSNAVIAKALSVLQNDSIEHISDTLGRGHKVRSFYNNIVAPSSLDGDVTIDTHAVAAAQLLPLGAKSLEATHNFGGAGNNIIHGISGMYPVYADAYREAAKDLGILPRELQSITWEASRGLFAPDFKVAEAKREGKGNAIIRNLWKEFKEGRASYEKTRNAVVNASGGIQDPVWYQDQGIATGVDKNVKRRDDQVYGQKADSSFKEELPRNELPRGNARGVGDGTGNGATGRATGRSGKARYSIRKPRVEGDPRFDAIKQFRQSTGRARGTSNEVSRAYRGEGKGDVGSLGLTGKKFVASKKFAEILTELGENAPPLIMIPKGPKSAKAFHKAITESKTKNKFGASVYVYDEKDYTDMKMFLTETGTAGFAIKSDGDLVSVFSTPGSTDGRVGVSMTMAAVDNGATKLDAFDTILPELYSIIGFKETGRDSWSDEYMPDDWDKKVFADFNKGEPDVVYMEYDAGHFELYEKPKAKFSVRKPRFPKKDKLGFYSRAIEAAENLKLAKGPPAQLLALLKKQEGVKTEELDWAGVTVWAQKNKGKQVTREDLAEQLAKAPLRLDELVSSGMQFDRDTTEFAEVALPYSLFEEDAQGNIEAFDNNNWEVADEILSPAQWLGADMRITWSKMLDQLFGPKIRKLSTPENPLNSEFQTHLKNLDRAIIHEGIGNASQRSQAKELKENFIEFLDNLDLNPRKALKSRMRPDFEKAANEKAEDDWLNDPVIRLEPDVVGTDGYYAQGSNELGFWTYRAEKEEVLFSNREEAEQAVLDYLVEDGVVTNEGGGAKYERRYTTGGPYTNYREVKVSLPDVNDHLPPYEHRDHWRDSDPGNIIVFLRLTDRMVNGMKTLFIEEMQSDWQAAAVKRGTYEDRDEQAARSEGYREELSELKRRHREGEPYGVEEFGRMKYLEDRIINRDKEVPEAPFTQDNWRNLGLKRALTIAAEGGYQQIGWPDSSILFDRYKDPSAMNAYKMLYEKKMPSLLKKIMGAKGVKAEKATALRDQMPTVGELVRQGVSQSKVKEMVLAGRTAPLALKDGLFTKIPEGLNDKVKNEGLARFRRRSQSAGPASPGIGLPAETLAAAFIRKFQDKYKRLKDVQNKITETGGVIADAANAYVKETQSHGKIENDLLFMEDEYIRPLAALMSEYKLTTEVLNDYLYARHAEERNIHIASIREDMPDGGSGMTTQQARDKLATYANHAQFQEIQELAAIVDQMTAKRRELIKGELEVDDIIDTWQSAYRHYVPLKHAVDETARPHTGQGFNIGGNESRRTTGRGEGNLADDPLGYVLNDLTETFIRKEKNEVGKSFLKLVEDNPDPDLWQVYTKEDPEIAPRLVSTNEGDKVRYAARAMAMLREDYFTTKKDGKTYFIRVEDPLLMRAMKNLGPEHNNKLIRGMAWYTRILSSLNTSYNPEFIITNFLRDLQTAGITLEAEQTRDDGKIRGQAIVKQTMKDVPKAMKAVWAASRGRDGGQWGQIYRNFLADGGKTGWFDMKDVDGQAKRLESLISMANGGFTGNARKIWSGTADFVNHANGAVENAVRLSAYHNAIQSGASRQQAAFLAKDMTVNFNRRGEVGTTLNALFMFANASIQGTANMARVMAGFNNDAKLFNRDAQGNRSIDIKALQWKNLNNGQKIAIGIAAGSFAMAAMNRMAAGEDDDDQNWYDKVPDFEKERNFIIMKSLVGGPQDGTYWKIPMPYGYNVFSILGTSTEGHLSGPDSAGKAAANLFKGALAAYSPLGLAESKTLGGELLKNATPTFAKPLVDVRMNENFFQSPIFRENFPGSSAPLPNSSLALRSTSPAFKSLAEFMNKTTGGSFYRSGAIDVNPDIMAYYASSVLGASGAFWGKKLPDFASKAINDVELEASRVPFLGRVSGKVRHYQDQSLFYKRKDELNQIYNEARKTAGPAKADYMKEFGDKVALRPLLKDTEKRLKLLRKQRDVINALDLSPKVRDQRLKVVETRLKGTLARFNKRYNVVDAR